MSHNILRIKDMLIPDPLFVLEMANNHMGDVRHGLRVIREFAMVRRDFPFTFAFKMQYRQLDSFIHPDYQNRMDVKYIKRFVETRLSRGDTLSLVAEIKAQGFLAVCTPFDPESVDRIVEDGFDLLKIASSSLTDWPLLERIAACDLPVIASVAGASVEEIDNVVGFMAHRSKIFALLHCVAEYPTPINGLQLNQIDFLRHRYPDLRIGFSTHESPDETRSVGIAVAKGSSIFEKHVAVPTETYPANAYSATPGQVRAWLIAAKTAYDMCGTTTGRNAPTEAELASLHALRRGVFARRDLQAGERIGDADVFMAIPTREGQVTANDWSKYSHYHTTVPIRAGDALLEGNTCVHQIRKKVFEIVQQVKAMLQRGHVVIPGRAQLEISHHYGIDRFDQIGICMVEVVNRGYCKKLLILLPGQSHPEQYHRLKEESFHVLHGQVELALDGEQRTCVSGDVVTVRPGVRHVFSSQGGAVIEELSSTHYRDDSYYTDPAIQNNQDRKTFISFWTN